MVLCFTPLQLGASETTCQRRTKPASTIVPSSLQFSHSFVSVLGIAANSSHLGDRACRGQKRAATDKHSQVPTQDIVQTCQKPLVPSQAICIASWKQISCSPLPDGEGVFISHFPVLSHLLLEAFLDLQPHPLPLPLSPLSPPWGCPGVVVKKASFTPWLADFKYWLQLLLAAGTRISLVIILRIIFLIYKKG